MRNRKFKYVLLAFFVFQTFFAMFATNILNGGENLFPFFNWKIFHTRPDKFWERDFIFIREIDDQVYDPPVEFAAVSRQFPAINMYTIRKKLERFSDNLTGPESEQNLALVNGNLLMDHRYVAWQLVRQRFELIDYYTKHIVLDRRVLGEFQAGVKP